MQLAVLFFATCGLTTSEREHAVLQNYSEENQEKYAELLVDIARYTTSGTEFHKKYYRHLISIAGEIVEKKKLAIEKGSVGFYYDKKLGDRNKLYLGVDIDTKSNHGELYETVAVSLIRGSLNNIMQTINACRSIFAEKEIIGMVIGWAWSSGGRSEHLSVWILKDDFIKYEDGMITFDELIQRSTSTNTAGRVIRLPL